MQLRKGYSDNDSLNHFGGIYEAVNALRKPETRQIEPEPPKLLPELQPVDSDSGLAKFAALMGRLNRQELIAEFYSASEFYKRELQGWRQRARAAERLLAKSGKLANPTLSRISSKALHH